MAGVYRAGQGRAGQGQAAQGNGRAEQGSLGGHDSQRQQSGPSGRAGPGSGAACDATPLLHCCPQPAVPPAALPVPCQSALGWIMSHTNRQS